MKSNLFYSALMLLSVCAFAGCDDDKETSEVLTPAVLQGKVYTLNADEVGQPWEGNQTIGVTMLKANSTEVVSPYHNIKYKTATYPVGYFSPISTDDVLYYPADGSKVDIVAYYPYKDNLKDNLYPMSVANQTVADNFKFIYANNSKGLNKDNKKTMMELRPVLSKLILKILPGDGVTEEYLAGASVKVTGMYTKADFNLLTGTYEVSSMTNVQDINFPALAPEDGIGASGQILPSASTSGYVLKITLPQMNRTYTWAFNDLSKLEAGHGYLSKVKISLDKIEVVTTDNGAIENWEDGETENGNGSAYVPELIKSQIANVTAGIIEPAKSEATLPQAEWSSYIVPVNVVMETTVEKDASLNRNVIHANVKSGTGAAWYRQFVAYRMGGAEHRIYTLRFKAKGTDNKRLQVYIKTNITVTKEAKYIQVVTTSTSSFVGYQSLVLTPAYKEYSIDFDFSKRVDNGGATVTSNSNTTPADLADFFIGMSPIGVGTECYIDEVSLKVKN